MWSMSALLAGLPIEVPAATVNRCCAARGGDAICRAGSRIIIAGSRRCAGRGTESMSRHPMSCQGYCNGLPRDAQNVPDTTIGWRFINPVLRQNATVSDSDAGDRRKRRHRFQCIATRIRTALRAQFRASTTLYVSARQRGYRVGHVAEQS